MEEVDNILKEDDGSHHEEEAIERLKNAEWVSPSKPNESFENQNYSGEGNRQRNIVHQKKGDIIHSDLARNQRSVSQKAKKRNQEK